MSLNTVPSVQRLLGAALLCLSAAAAAAPDPSPRDDAWHAFREGRFAAAYGRLAALADAGDPEASQLALLMLRHGPTLFGSTWAASVPQQRRWALQVQHEMRRRIIGAADTVSAD